MSAHPKHMFRSQFRPKAIVIAGRMYLTFEKCTMEVNVPDSMLDKPKVVLTAVMQELANQMQDLGPIIVEELANAKNAKAIMDQIPEEPL